MRPLSCVRESSYRDNQIWPCMYPTFLFFYWFSLQYFFTAVLYPAASSGTSPEGLGANLHHSSGPGSGSSSSRDIAVLGPSTTDSDRNTDVYYGNESFKCTVCTSLFHCKSDLTRHMCTHTGKKVYKCAYCSRLFTRKYDVVRHARQHTGEKPFTCNICSRAFYSKESLRYHSSSTHKTKEAL